MVSKIRESKIYEPYIWEAVHEAGVITVAFIAALTVLILVIKINFLYIGSFFAVILLIDLVVNCRMLVLIPLEKRYYGIKNRIIGLSKFVRKLSLQVHGTIMEICESCIQKTLVLLDTFCCAWMNKVKRENYGLLWVIRSIESFMTQLSKIRNKMSRFLMVC